jgi:3-hydroxyisobutyrate dehydrogenase
MSSASAAIGFIGLGIMGRPMAGHLQEAGHRLFVHSRTRSKGDDLVAGGATWCDKPADAARECDIIFTIVTDTPDVKQVLFGRGGLSDALREGAIVVDMSTISPSATRGFAEQLAESGAALLDAPVTGGDVGARNGTLTIMVGGDAKAFAHVHPLLLQMGKNIVRVGPSGAGQMMKACNQILCAVNMIAVCEALSLAHDAKLDASQLIETLGTGAGGSWALSNLGPKIVSGDLDPAFMIDLIQKDLRIVQQEAERLHIALPGTALAQQLFRAVAKLEDDGGRLGTQGMIKAYEALQGRG